MTTPEVLPITSEAAITRAVRVLRDGGLVVMPTDTVYGLAAALDRPAALSQIFEAKGRSETKPLPVLLADPAALALVAAEPTEAVMRLAERFWPGPLTLAVPAARGLPAAVLAPDGTAGVRVPNHDATRRLIAAAGGALAVTSANRSGHPAAMSAADARAQLGAAVDLVLDGGPSPGGVASTVAAVSNDGPRVFREGPISGAALAAVWQEMQATAEARSAG